MRPVGILGGMGPEATILLMRKVMEAVPAQDDADHVPLIVHQNPGVPSRIAHLIERTGEDPTPVLQDMARALEAAGAAALAMPCNTAHAYAGAIRDATALPFLDMVEATADRLAESGARRIGMLASPATRLASVFEAPFAARGLTPVFPDPDDAVLALIRAVKRGEAPETLAPDLGRIAEDLLAEADTLCVACTELSLIVPWLNGVAVTDSLDALVAEIVEFARG
ncbi:amino acid racemase [Roseibacterium sp. SDUM158016]|uniref:aspartate/glutamate racemase family protein n=1 Tax=Roseicyclus sediminis TaxID=2980997 RepID=UPI0021D2F440|nr:amino acid racemase [Roseibacterium sp. SDUM158016]MCU4653173.1 amino acid racemase [Roseibacterium sp. SDUM158016]